MRKRGSPYQGDDRSTLTTKNPDLKSQGFLLSWNMKASKVTAAIRQIISGHLPKPPKKRTFWRQYYNEDGSTIPSNKAK